MVVASPPRRLDADGDVDLLPHLLDDAPHPTLLRQLIPDLIPEVGERVLAAVTPHSIATAVEVTRRGLEHWFALPRPRIALCALNPHAGDGGRFGTEDDLVLAPVARSLGVAGPFPADTVFVRALRGEFDAVIAPYHDVGMTAIKVAAFGRAVTVTLGLPFPRTSPDHGTAMDIAGRGLADTSSMKEAVRMCAEISRRVADALSVSPASRQR